jgi:hypothetical protein
MPHRPGDAHAHRDGDRDPNAHGHVHTDPGRDAACQRLFDA